MVKNILLTGGRAPATLHLARLLYQKGYQVYVADTFARNLTAASNYIHQSFVVPPPRQAPKSFANSLLKIIKDYDIDYLLPTCEETFYVALHQARFERYCTVFTSDIALLDELHNKWRFNQLLSALDLPCPRSYLAASQQELKQAMHTLGGSFVAKPTYSRFADHVIINKPTALAKITIHKKRTWLIQEFLAGEHFCSFSIVEKGRLVAHAVYPVSYRVKDGAAVYFEAVDVPAIATIVTKIVETQNYTGFIAFDFIYKKEDEQYYALECNPRLTSGIHLYDHQDAFMPFENNKVICYPKEENKMMLTLALVAYQLMEQPSMTSIRAMIKALLTAKDVVFSWRDVKPFLAQFLTVLHFYSLAKQQHISILEATTHHIEWNGEQEKEI